MGKSTRASRSSPLDHFDIELRASIPPLCTLDHSAQQRRRSKPSRIKFYAVGYPTHTSSWAQVFAQGQKAWRNKTPLINLFVQVGVGGD